MCTSIKVNVSVILIKFMKANFNQSETITELIEGYKRNNNIKKKGLLVRYLHVCLCVCSFKIKL